MKVTEYLRFLLATYAALYIKIGELVMGFVTILIAIFLAPTIASQVTLAVGNFSGAAAALWPLITLLFVVVVICIGVTLVYNSLKGTGQ